MPHGQGTVIGLPLPCWRRLGWKRGTAGLADRAMHTLPTPKRGAELCEEAPASPPASLCHFPDFPLYCSSCRFVHPQAVSVTPAAWREHLPHGPPASSGTGSHHPGKPQVSIKLKDNWAIPMIHLSPNKKKKSWNLSAPEPPVQRQMGFRKENLRD